MFRFFILVGYFGLMAQLQVSGKMDQYINSHYSYLVYLSMFFSVLLAIVQLIHWARNEKECSSKTCAHDHSSYKHPSGFHILGYGLLILPILIGLCFPTVNLNTSIVEAKGFQFPLSQESKGDSFMETQYLKPDTSIFFNQQDYNSRMKKDLAEFENQEEIVLTDENFLKVVELIYTFPSQFDGKKIRFTGFVYLDPVEKKNHLFLFRFGIIHCVADSGVFGLLIHLPETQNFSPKNDEWFSVTGTLHSEFYTPFKREIPTVTVAHVKKIKAPEQQYVYRKF